MTRGPVHDRNQVQKAELNGDVRDVGTPDLIGPVDDHSCEKIGLNPVRRMGCAGLWRLIDRLQPHEVHQTKAPVAPHTNALAPQLAHHLTGTVKRILQK